MASCIIIFFCCKEELNEKKNAVAMIEEGYNSIKRETGKSLPYVYS